MKRVLISIMAPLLLLAAVLTAAPGANAESGGGCHGSSYPVDPCISWTGSFLVADFYVNPPAPDWSRCRGVLQIVRNGTIVRSQDFDLTRTGRYGPISIASSSGWAEARVHVYYCDGRYHYRPTSPRLYYP